MTKLIGIVTPLVLRLVVVVALRLISYTKGPVRLYHTRVVCQDHIVQVHGFGEGKERRGETGQSDEAA